MTDVNDKDFLEMCKAHDPSADVDAAKQLQVIKTKLREEEILTMKNERRFKKPIVALVAALVGLLSLSVVAFAAVPALVRYLDARVVEGDRYVAHFEVREYELGEYDDNIVVWEFEWADRPGIRPTERIVVEVDGDEYVLHDMMILYDLDEALALFAKPNVALPTYLPSGFVFDHARFNTCPCRDIEALDGSHDITIVFSNGQDIINMTIVHFRGIEWELRSWSDYMEFLEINGNVVTFANGMLAFFIEDTMYYISFQERNHDLEQIHQTLIQFAESINQCNLECYQHQYWGDEQYDHEQYGDDYDEQYSDD